jgi:hypothetical protein
MVLIVLIVLWSVVLVPPAWQAHVERRRARQVDAFRRKLSVLAPAPDTPLARRPMDASRPSEAARAHVAVMAPRNVVRLPVAEAEPVEFDTGELSAVAADAAARRADRARARVDVLRRRQQVLMGLMVATVISLAGAFVIGDTRIWAAHGMVVLAFTAYLTGLRRLKRLAMERQAKVRFFPPAPAATAPPASQPGDGQADLRRARAAVR